MRFTATTSPNCDTDAARREARQLCRAIDRGQSNLLPLKNFTFLAEDGETEDGKTEIEFTCRGRRFIVRADSKV